MRCSFLIKYFFSEIFASTEIIHLDFHNLFSKYFMQHVVTGNEELLNNWLIAITFTCDNLENHIWIHTELRRWLYVNPNVNSWLVSDMSWFCFYRMWYWLDVHTHTLIQKERKIWQKTFVTTPPFYLQVRWWWGNEITFCGSGDMTFM